MQNKFCDEVYMAGKAFDRYEPCNSHFSANDNDRYTWHRCYRIRETFAFDCDSVKMLIYLIDKYERAIDKMIVATAIVVKCYNEYEDFNGETVLNMEESNRNKVTEAILNRIVKRIPKLANSELRNEKAVARKVIDNFEKAIARWRE